MNSTKRTYVKVLSCVIAVAAGLLVAAPGAQAKQGPVTATWKLPAGGYALGTGMGAVWALDADEWHDAVLLRLDPSTHALKPVARLSFPAGSLEVAFGSLWISDYFGNAVWRLAPDGHVQAQIAVGLQPEQMHGAFGSLWVSNHHGASLSRIDPSTNSVIDTIGAGAPDTFFNGPQSVTDDGTRVYVGDSNLQSLQSVDPSTDAVTTPPGLGDAFCGPLLAAGGFVWSVDRCSGTTYQLGTDGTIAQTFVSSGMPFGATATADGLWIGDDTAFDPNTGAPTDAVLEERDPSTGALLQSIAIGGNGENVVSGFGALWVYDGGLNALERVAL